jgi:hypothetical protein
LELFQGLWIDSGVYDFKKYPTVKLNMSGESGTETEVKSTIINELKRAAETSKIATQQFWQAIMIQNT